MSDDQNSEYTPGQDSSEDQMGTGTTSQPGFGQDGSGMDDETAGGMSEQDLGTGSAGVEDDEDDLDDESIEGDTEDSEEDDVESTGQTGEGGMGSGVDGTSGSGGSYGN